MQYTILTTQIHIKLGFEKPDFIPDEVIQKKLVL